MSEKIIHMIRNKMAKRLSTMCNLRYPVKHYGNWFLKGPYTYSLKRVTCIHCLWIVKKRTEQILEMLDEKIKLTRTIFRGVNDD